MWSQTTQTAETIIARAARCFAHAMVTNEHAGKTGMQASTPDYLQLKGKIGKREKIAAVCGVVPIAVIVPVVRVSPSTKIFTCVSHA